MLLAAAFVAITLVVLAVLVLPILRGVRAAPERAQYDRAVYRDQLAELDRDVARGLIGAREAQSARVEIQRRLLAADAAPAAPLSRGGGGKAVALAVAVLVAGGSAALYLRLGSPGLPDEPYASRVIPSATAADESEQDVAKAVAALAERLKERPADKEGWLLYARTTAAMGDWAKSVDAYKHLIDLGGADADATAAYGEVLVVAAGGMVTPAADSAFTATLAKQPGNPIARYYLALGRAQAGEPKQAIDAWLALAAEAPEGSPMRDELVRRILETAKVAGLPEPKLPAAASAK